MEKIIYQDSSDELMRSVAANGESMVTLIETSTGVKSAASSLISKELLEQYRPKDDKTACIHLIAMGNSDQYGFNRNGDYFAGDVLEKNAHTFVTNGHMFREHRNKDPKKAIGSVKYAGYDPKGMQRVELIVHMDKDKAEEEYQMAKQGKALSFSMSCRVPNDRCSICGNEAKSISKYCEHLGRHMGQYDRSFKKYAFAYNDQPTFFDISKVNTPADRIAHFLSYSFNDGSDICKAASVMCKSASYDGESGPLLPSAAAAIAEGLYGGLNLDEQNMLCKLAAEEAYIHDTRNAAHMYKSAKANDAYTVYPFAMMSRLTPSEIEACRNVRPDTLFREMAKKACVLSFPAFCQYLSGMESITDTGLFKKAALMLPDVFSSMMPRMLTMHPCTDEFSAGDEWSSDCDPGKCDLVQKVMNNAEDKFSVKDGPVRRRVIQITIIQNGMPANADAEFDKAAAVNVSDEEAMDLASTYGQYQLRALCDIDRFNPGVVTADTHRMIAGANSVMLYDYYGK
jgi:hypothetical protein